MTSEQEPYIRVPIDFFPDPNSPNGRIMARHRANEEACRKLLKRNPEGYTNRYIAFADGKFLARVHREDPTKAEEVIQSFMKKASTRAKKLGIDFGAAFVTFVPSD